MKFLGIIPSRYASTRFPGKPLADLCGKPLIRRVYEQVYELLDETVVATDDERIYQAVQDFGGKAVMTSPDHPSGTDRCYEAYTKTKGDFDVVINIQGDEPFINPKQIELLKACFSDPQTQIATLVKPFPVDTDFETLSNPNTPKVVINPNMQAIYFSRSVIPYIRGKNHTEWLKSNTFYKHIGIYAYKCNVLEAIAALPPTALEKAESLEQLRWIENHYIIKVGITDEETIGIDTPDDLAQAVLRISTASPRRARGTPGNCQCGCHYATNNGSNTSDNDSANNAYGYTSDATTDEPPTTGDSGDSGGSTFVIPPQSKGSECGYADQDALCPNSSGCHGSGFF